MLRRRSAKHLPSTSPYPTRTPRTRKLLTQALSVVSDTEDETRFQELVSFKKWCAYRVTPMYFHYEANKLHEYSQKLQSYLEIGKMKPAALVGQQSAYSVIFSVIKGVACTENDSEAVQIVITSRAEKSSASAVFIGILLSVERETKHDLLRSKDKRYLPVFLVHGSTFLTKAVTSFLEDSFGCIVTPLIFSSCDLMWMLAMWAVNQYERGTRPLMLEYALPYKELHTVQYTIDAKTVREVWCRVHSAESNVMHVNEVQEFIKSLEKHFQVLFRIDLSHFQLRSVGTPAAAVHSNGSIKFLNPDSVKHILRHLTSLAQEVEIH